MDRWRFHCLVCIATCLVCLAGSMCRGQDQPKFRPGRLIALLGEDQKNLVPNASFECGTNGWGSTEAEVLPGWHGTLNGLFGRLDRTTAADGATSLKIELTPENMPVAFNDYLHTERQPIKAPLAANVGWLAVNPGQKYTLSVSMKAAEPGTPARLVVRQFHAAPIERLVRLTADWRRYQLEFTAAAPACYVLAGPDLRATEVNPHPPERATVWLDAVQLSPGNAPAPFVTRQPVELGIATDRPGNIFAWEESLQFQITVASAETKQKRKAEIDLRLTDFFDEEVWRDTKSLTILPQSSQNLTVVLPPSPQRRGFLGLHGALTRGNTLDRRDLRLAAIPVYPLADSRFGLNHAFGWPEMLELCRKAGLIWMRDWSLKWQDVEPQSGQFTFEESDAEINRLLQQDLKVLAVLAFPSSMWSSSAPANIQPQKPWYHYPTTAPDPETQRDDILAEVGTPYARMGYAPRDMKEFENYVAQTVAHYKDRVHDWEVFNEPILSPYALPGYAGYKTADHVRYVEHFAQAARRADPRCRILGGYNLSGMPATLEDWNRAVPGSLEEWLRFISLGGLKNLDVFTLHAYPGQNTPEQVEQLLEPVRKAMDEQGARRPIWFTEHAYFADDEPWSIAAERNFFSEIQLPSERLQAEYEVRFSVMLFANGGEKIFYHAGTGSAINQGNVWTMFLRYGGEPYKCYASQAVLAQLLTPNCKFVKRLLPEGPLRAYLFTDGHRTVGVFWAPAGAKPQTLQLAHPKLQLWDLMGRPQASQTFTPGESPMYIVGEGVPAPEFENAVIVAP
jgi:hypothetical protein